ncbi:MAG: hypothetical protein MUF34_11695 [Polyangiaceae bacterium]|jgi:ABC-type dipeptide/oligopeptide/nickel transport system permease component|nr:hypothetical protein [Polyangiaceae bacterium]
MIWQALGASVDLFHALLMVMWVVGLPLLFWHRWPRLTRAYGVYSIAFIVVSQTSQYFLGECVFTTLARALWQQASPDGVAQVSSEWFTVRLAEAVFHLTPSHRSIKRLSEALILVSAVGALIAMRRLPKQAERAPLPVRLPVATQVAGRAARPATLSLPARPEKSPFRTNPA